MSISGVWLPIITPFNNDQVDFESYEKLVHHYINQGINGLILSGTTGESAVLDEAETAQIIEHTIAITNKKLPVYIGLASNATHKATKIAQQLEKFDIDGFLALCPYYNRPSQEGLYQHFKALAESTAKNIIIYNIPYRTGVNLQNDVLFKLAGFKNIVGIKDCCAILPQSLELIANKPAGFSVLTGEDPLFYNMLAQGADGGILASAHINTAKFIKVFRLMQENKYKEALAEWSTFANIIPLLFKEPNPSPIKYCLWKQGLIKAEDLRLPLTPITNGLRQELNQALKLTA